MDESIMTNHGQFQLAWNIYMEYIILIHSFELYYIFTNQALFPDTSIFI